MIYPPRQTRQGRWVARNGKTLRIHQMGKYNTYVENKYGEDFYMAHVYRWRSFPSRSEYKLRLQLSCKLVASGV